MEYVLSEEEFNKDFKINDNENDRPQQLTHTSGKKIKVFPYNTKNEILLINQVIGDYLRAFEDEIPFIGDNDQFLDKLENDVDTDNPEKFRQVVTDLFFSKDEDGNIQVKPLSIEFMSLIPCKDKYQRLSRYLSSVLGTFGYVKTDIETNIESSRKKQDSQSNVLEMFIKDEFEYVKNPEKSGENQYYKVVNCFDECFNADFHYIVQEKLVKEYLEELLSLYYINYTIQACLQLNNFMRGERNRLREVYYCLEWEKTNQNRLCYKQGWKSIQGALSKMFVHANVLEMLNLTQNSDEKYDYIRLKELIDEGLINDSEAANQIKKINDLYIKHITDIDLKDISYKDDYPYKTESAIHHLFDCVETQFLQSKNNRLGAMNDFYKSFTGYCKRNYIQTRGRSGDMLCLSEDRLIFLTKLCIKNQEKMRLNDVFKAFSIRGIFLDTQSKEAVTDFYERLNLIEKKSDSGDAQYVKRIL